MKYELISWTFGPKGWLTASLLKKNKAKQVVTFGNPDKTKTIALFSLIMICYLVILSNNPVLTNIGLDCIPYQEAYS